MSHIGEQNGDDLTLPLHRGAAGEDILSQQGRSIRTRAEAVKGGWMKPVKIVAALAAELSCTGQGMGTLRACPVHHRAAALNAAQ